jgi:hypothetical protein
MRWGEKGYARYGTKRRLRRETDTRTPCVIESPHSSLQSQSPPFGRLGSSAGLDRPFEMVRWELPKSDCGFEAHFKRGETSPLI